MPWYIDFLKSQYIGVFRTGFRLPVELNDTSRNSYIDTYYTHTIHTHTHRLPVELNETSRISSLCPRKVFISCPDFTSQILQVRSIDPVMHLPPSQSNCVYIYGYYYYLYYIILYIYICIYIYTYIYMYVCMYGCMYKYKINRPGNALAHLPAELYIYIHCFPYYITLQHTISIYPSIYLSM